jgi:uncharacterized protein YcgI (DUF1989 family)
MASSLPVLDPRSPHLCPTPLDRSFYGGLAARLAEATVRSAWTLDGYTGLGVDVAAGELVTVELAEGAQIVGMLLFNLHDPDERFWNQGSVREGLFLTRYTRLWGTMARYRPLATVLEDTVTPGSDTPLGYHHPILSSLGTRAEWEWAGGTSTVRTTWEQLAALVAARGIDPFLISESIALFQKAMIMPYEQRLMILASDAIRGDRLTFFAEIDLCILFALSPYLDGSRPPHELADPKPRSVVVTVTNEIATPLPWPYEGVPYPDLSLYLNENGVRSDVAEPTPGHPNEPLHSK